MNSALSDVIDTERKYPDIRDTQNCDAFHQSNLNTSSSSPNHSQPSLSLQPAVKITDKDDGCVDNKNSQNDVSDRHLQNCDISISPPGIINTSSSTSCYVYTKKSEISKNHFEETVRTQEISSFYDISNSSTVWTFLEIYWEINSFFITSTLYWIQCNVKKCIKWTGPHEDGAEHQRWPIRGPHFNYWPIRGHQRTSGHQGCALVWRVRDVTLFKLEDYKAEAYLQHCSAAYCQNRRIL